MQPDDGPQLPSTTGRRHNVAAGIYPLVFEHKLSCFWWCWAVCAPSALVELGWLRSALPSQGPCLHAHGAEMFLQCWAAALPHLLLSFSLVMSFSLSVLQLLLFCSFQPADGTKKITLSPPTQICQNEVSRS